MTLDQETDSLGNLAWISGPMGKRVLQLETCGECPASDGSLSFFAPDFALGSPRPWWVGRELSEWPQTQGRPFPVVRSKIASSQMQFMEMHRDILERIQAHEFEKVVPITSERLEFADKLSLSMFAHLWSKTQVRQFSFGFSFGGVGMVGLTPELLFSLDRNSLLSTMALAGTGPADGFSLLNDAKERREHNLVIEHIDFELHQLFNQADWGQPHIHVGQTEERVYGKLKHLYTPISVQLPERPTFAQLVRRLHPTAALGGWPREPALNWLKSQPFHLSRGRFGAPFGYQDRDAMFCVVAIRCLQWQGTMAELNAGCGVVQGSESEKEWNELRLKRQSVCDNLGLPQ